MNKKPYNWEARDARVDRLRIQTQDRYLTRLEKLEAKADPMVGELCRDGKTVYYIVTARGKVRESGSRQDLIDFLIRNHYVR